MNMPEVIFYLLLNAFRVYIMYRFFSLFFEDDKQKKWLTYGYFLLFLINSIVYLFFNNELVNLVINVGGLLIINIFGYLGSIWKKLISVTASCGMSLLTENIAWVIFVKGRNVQMEEFGFFFSVFMFFLMEIILERTIELHRGFEISLYKDLLLVLISVGSMFISSVLIDGIYHNISLLIVALCILLLINIAVFYLYEKMLDDYVKQKDKEMYRLQLTMYQKQLQIMQSANDTYKIMRHDIKHHMFLIADYIKNNENEKALQYLNKINNFVGNGNQYVKTGNESIDSIFNYIIDEVHRNGGTVNADIKVAEEMVIDDFDINVILSNLLLNSCEAICMCDKKEIQAVMKYDRGILFIKISNTYNGVIEQKGGEFSSTKQDNKDHGIGLASVRRMVEKYNGDMHIEYTDEEFIVKILMYI